ncbi:Hypothetical protein FKW44_020278 [Caligus rogercresseyi]|uniref:Uncharacterized protein n=1 Tax=Caligus rogercresseyi TaxID=217165 RepID=A0A7T8GXR8_CALRO|nr:Hypothetical protein FKW44_020278 [Caligus rogercresseyi]
MTLEEQKAALRRSIGILKGAITRLSKQLKADLAAGTRVSRTYIRYRLINLKSSSEVLHRTYVMYLSLNLTVEEVLKAGEDEIVSQEIVELIVKVEEHLKIEWRNP